jgi:hypothetical protein
MSSVALSGSDVVNINNRIFNDLPDADCFVLTFPNAISQTKTGKNGNSIYGLNESGRQCEAVVRVLRGSADDKYLLNLLTQQQSNFAGTVLLIGEFVKQIGDGAGNIASDTYILSGGVFDKQVEAKMNTEGDTEQSIATYHMKFTNSPRVLT